MWYLAHMRVLFIGAGVLGGEAESTSNASVQRNLPVSLLLFLFRHKKNLQTEEKENLTKESCEKRRKKWSASSQLNVSGRREVHD